MSEFKFACPFCQQHFLCDEQFSGRQIQCAKCKHLLRIPRVPGKTAQYTPESGQTWATFVSSGDVAPPANVSLPSKNNPRNSPDK